jgi:protein required for attachment to host cells
MPRKITTWIVVADGQRARFLLREVPGAGLRPVGPGELTNPDSGKPTRAMGTDRPGRAFGDRSGARSAMEPRVDWHRQAKENFAHRVAKEIDKAAQEGAFDRLVIVAPPATLGELRASLGDAARARIQGEMAKDLTMFADRELAEHLADILKA